MIPTATYLDASLDQLVEADARIAEVIDPEPIEIAPTVTDYPNITRIRDVVTYEVW